MPIPVTIHITAFVCIRGNRKTFVYSATNRCTNGLFIRYQPVFPFCCVAKIPRRRYGQGYMLAFERLVLAYHGWIYSACRQAKLMRTLRRTKQNLKDYEQTPITLEFIIENSIYLPTIVLRRCLDKRVIKYCNSVFFLHL